jgi:hypothetical protein
MAGVIPVNTGLSRLWGPAFAGKTGAALWKSITPSHTDANCALP